MEITSYLLGKKNGGGGSEPTGEISITSNGTHNVKSYATANVNVSGSATYEDNDVNFCDYDGTIVYSCSASDFANMTEMPENPTREGLTAQGWNWSLADAKEFVQECGILDIGQSYKPTDNKTHIFVKIDKDTKSPYLGFAVNGTATINWGDNTSENVVGTSTTTVIQTQHTYTNIGEYEITIASDTTIYFVQGSTNFYGGYLINGGTTSTTDIYRRIVKKIYLNDNVSCATYSLTCMPCLEIVIMPKGGPVFNLHGIFFADTGLKAFVIPLDKKIGSSMFYNCYNLKRACTSSNSVDDCLSAFNYTWSLNRMCYKGKRTNTIVTNSGVKEPAFFLPSNGNKTFSEFEACYRLEKVVFPSVVTTITTNTCRYCSSLKVADFRKCSSVVTCSGTPLSVTNSIPIIVVPDALYEDWVADSTWSNFASTNRIVKASDYIE